jgi:signal transduction histidine kinase
MSGSNRGAGTLADTTEGDVRSHLMGTRPQRGLAPGAIAILAIAAAALCAGAVILTLAGAPAGDRAWAAVTSALVIAAPIGVGLATLARRQDRFAAVLVGAGALWSLTVLAQAHDPTLYSVGRIAAWVVDIVVVYLLLSFPSGRLTSSPARVAMGATVVLIGLLYLPTALVVQHFPEPSPWSTCGTDCPPNAFAIGDTTPAFVEDFVRPLREGLSALVFLGVAVVLAQRTYRAGPLLRRMLVPVLAMAAFRGVALAAYDAARGSAPTAASLDALGWVYILSLALIALSFSVGMLWRGLYATTALQRLTLGLTPQTTPQALRGALADALEDPSLQIAYRLPDGLAGWVNETATRVEPPRVRRDRIMTEVRVNGRRIAALDTDASLAQDPALLQAAASYALMVLENGRLVRRLTSSIGELSASRARIVAVSDQARRRIERDVHDGAQQRLVALRIKLALESERLEHEAPQTAAELELLGAEVDETIDEVRAIAHGIYPSVLSDRGLVEALRAAARSMPVSCTVQDDGIGRHSHEIESAVYFACVGALASVGREATRVVITLRADESLRFEVRDDDPGSPRPERGEAWLDEPLDRLAGVAGELTVEAVPGEGTRVTGSVPLR